MLELAQRPPSQVEAALPREAKTLSLTGALERLRSTDLPVRNVAPASDRTVADTIWELQLDWEREDGSHWPVRVYARATEHELFGFHVELGTLEADVADAVRQCRYGVGVQCILAEPVLWHYHAQLQLLHLLAPQTAGVLDVGAARARPADWLAEAATSRTPPHPDNLFSIHAVFDEEDRMWLHTHGLQRCGVIEIDILDAETENAWALQNLMNVVAKRFIDQGYPEQDEPFTPGQGMELVWLPVDRALSTRKRTPIGGWDDRDDVHLEDRGILLRKEKGWFWGHYYRNLDALVPVLEDNPLLYVSHTETERAASLARERLPRFAALLERLGDHPSFSFLTKLAFTMDGRSEEEREHLWFEVHALDSTTVEATCLNAPYHVTELREGQRGRYPLERLSDFAVLSPLGQVGPDHIRIVETVANDEEALEQLAKVGDTT